MKRLIVISLLALCALAKPPVFPKIALKHHGLEEPELPQISVSTPKTDVNNDHEQRQNEAARYKFSSNIDDHISDLTHQRNEEREGLSLKGSYSYSDGYHKRTIHYVADQNGYRVTGMETVPLDGPHVNPSGTASVETALHGTHVAYRVQGVPVEGPVVKVIGEGEDAWSNN